MGHSSIVITANCYAHLQPAANLQFADALDSTPSLPTSAHRTHTTNESQIEGEGVKPEAIDKAGFLGGPGRIRTYNQQIMSLLL